MFDFSFNMDQFGNINFLLAIDKSSVKVEVIRATELVPGLRSKTANPFVLISLLPERHNQLKSTIQRNTLEPTFKEVFIFDAEKPLEKTLEILVLDGDELEQFFNQLKSTIKRNTLEPTFKEVFIFDAEKPLEKTLEILVLDDDELEEYRLLGLIHFPLEQMKLTRTSSSIWKSLSRFDTNEEVYI